MTAELVIPTSEGDFRASYSEHGLIRVAFPASPRRRVAASQMPRRRRAVAPPIDRWHQMTTRAIRSTLGGRTPGRLPPLDFGKATPFQREVWAVIRRIKRGQTWTYTQVARALDRPQAVRAVGNACGANPWPVLIPCHRVVPKGGRLGGFSGGIEWKRRLLQLELTGRGLPSFVE